MIIFNMKKTKKAYEEWLNNLYQEDYSHDDAIEALLYLTGDRPDAITRDELSLQILSGTAGTLLKKMDPIAFEVGFNDWK